MAVSNSGYDSFRPDIEGLRSLAVLLVVLFHARFFGLDGGFIGVDVFFVISGYLISGLLIAEREQSGRIDFMRFYMRRARRLLPAAALMLVVTLAVGALILSPLELGTLARTALAMVFYLSNVWFLLQKSDYFGADTEQNPFLHTWSLAVEEQFYFFWPVLIFLLLRFCRRDRNLLWAFAGLTLLSYGLSVYWTASNQPFAFFSLPTRAWEFAIGAFARVAGTGWLAGRDRLVRLGSLAGLLTIFGSAFLITEKMPFPGVVAAVPVLATALLLYLGGLPVSTMVGSLLRSGPAQLIGKLSYSWYLWHWPFLVYANILAPGPDVLFYRLLAVIGSFAAAAVTFYALENPIRRMVWLRQPLSRSMGLAGVLMGLSLVAVLSARDYARVLGDSAAQKYVFEQSQMKLLANEACHLNVTATEPANCRVGQRGAPILVVLFGDSHALHWLPALEYLAARRPYEILIATKSGCPAVEILPYSTILGRPYQECADWRKKVLRQIAAMKPALVVVGNSSGYLHYPPLVPAGEITIDDWAHGLASLLGKFDQAHIPALVIHDVPYPGFDVPTCLSRQIRRGEDVGRCDFSRAAAMVPGLAPAEERAGAGHSGVRFISFTDDICLGDVCKARIGADVVYRDANHLTSVFSRAQSDRLEAALRPLLDNGGRP